MLGIASAVILLKFSNAPNYFNISILNKPHGDWNIFISILTSYIVTAGFYFIMNFIPDKIKEQEEDQLAIEEKKSEIINAKNEVVAIQKEEENKRNELVALQREKKNTDIELEENSEKINGKIAEMLLLRYRSRLLSKNEKALHQKWWCAFLIGNFVSIR